MDSSLFAFFCTNGRLAKFRSVSRERLISASIPLGPFTTKGVEKTVSSMGDSAALCPSVLILEPFPNGCSSALRGFCPHLVLRNRGRCIHNDGTNRRTRRSAGVPGLAPCSAVDRYSFRYRLRAGAERFVSGLPAGAVVAISFSVTSQRFISSSASDGTLAIPQDAPQVSSASQRDVSVLAGRLRTRRRSVRGKPAHISGARYQAAQVSSGGLPSPPMRRDEISDR